MGKDTTSTGRIKKYGVCLNDKCENYKQIQEILRGDMECPVCKKKLSPCAPPKKKGGNGKLIGIIAAVVLVIAIAVLAFVFGGGTSANKNGEVATVDTGAQIESETPKTDNPESADVSHPDLTETDTVYVQFTDTIRDTVMVEKVSSVQEKPLNKEEKKSPSDSGKYSLPYGIYRGPLANGKPDGIGGEITVTKSYELDLKKQSGETLSLSVGDIIVNTKFVNSSLRQGELRRKDGSRKYIMI